jgi:hypothetical protein
VREEASGAKLHLGASSIANWSVKTLHHKNVEIRNHEIQTLFSARSQLVGI